MSVEKKLALLEEIMDLDEGTLSLTDNLADLDEWDSLSKLSLIVEAKHIFNLVLGTEQLKKFCTVQDICNYLQ